MRRPKNDLAIIILAAGRGTRMRSKLPKALHSVCGKPMLWFLLRNAKTLKPKKTVVVAGFGLKEVRAFVGADAQIVAQKRLLGSGDAVNQCRAALKGFAGKVLVLYCDTPLVSLDTLKKLLAHQKEHATACTLLSVELDNPSSYGRIKRISGGSVIKIVEANDADAEEKKNREVNVGCYVFDAEKLFTALSHVRRNPNKKEYYLTDVIEILAASGTVSAIATEDRDEVTGVNSRKDLARVEEIMQRRILEDWMEKGVHVRDPKSTAVDAGVEIGAQTTIASHTVIEDSCRIGERCQIGPFARVRGGSVIGNDAVIGNFVEIVRSRIGQGASIKHLSYIGDAEVGRSVNIGAGTITANYDGKKKHKTIIQDGAQLGSGTVLVAPVRIGKNAKTGAGAVVTSGCHVAAKTTVVGVPAKVLKKTIKRIQ